VKSSEHLECTTSGRGICVCMYEFGSSGGVVCDFIFSLASSQSKREGELISWKLTG
jgi:hypothetical protein